MQKEEERQIKILDKRVGTNNLLLKHANLIERSMHKQSLINFRDYLEEELKFLKEIGRFRTTWDKNVTKIEINIKKIKQDIKQLNKLIKNYE